VELHLVSTWSWDHTDPLARHLLQGTTLDDAFRVGLVTGRAREERTRWYQHLGTPEEAAFQAFLGALHFRLGYPASAELGQFTSERMELLGLQHDDAAIAAGTEQVWRWIDEGKREVTREDMVDAIAALELRQAARDAAVSLYLHTIRRDPVETNTDYELDWRHLFVGEEWERRHKVHDPAWWNSIMLPELRQVRERILQDSACRLVRVQGRARLSAWVALGFVFSRVAGWTLAVDQGGTWWRNDQAPAADLEITDEVESAIRPATFWPWE
jgi:hypothetical protein